MNELYYNIESLLWLYGDLVMLTWVTSILIVTNIVSIDHTW